MSSDRLFRSTHELDAPHEAGMPMGVPGKMPVTARLAARPINQIIFRVASRDGNGVAADADLAVDRAATSAGQPLPGDLRARFESSLGADLSGVRLHTGAESAQAADAVGARAYATGNDVHFAAGQFDPTSAFGVHLLAHEVAHTVQQQGAAPTRQHQLEVSGPADSAEVEADRAADAMVSGAPASVGAAGGALAREPAESTPAAESQQSTDKKDDEFKFPSWKDGKVSFQLPKKLGNAGIEMSLTDPPSGKASLAADVSAKFFDFSKTTGVNVLGPVQLVSNISGKGALTAGVEGEINGAWEDAPGPRADEGTKMLRVGGGGTAKVGPEVEGSMYFGPGLGIKSYTVTAGGKASIAATGGFNVDLKVDGACADPGQAWSGGATLSVVGQAKLEATTAIVADVILGEDHTNLYTHTLGKRTIGDLSVTCTMGVDFATGAVTDSPAVVVANWYGLMDAPLAVKRKLTDDERAELFPGAQGASGAPADVPEEIEERVDCSDPGAGGNASMCPEAPDTRGDFDGEGGGAPARGGDDTTARDR